MRVYRNLTAARSWAAWHEVAGLMDGFSHVKATQQMHVVYGVSCRFRLWLRRPHGYLLRHTTRPNLVKLSHDCWQ
jgi:hypothetical protein